MLTFEDEPVRASIAEATGVDVDLPLRAFPDLEANLKAQVERIRSHPWVKPVPVSGLVYEVETAACARSPPDLLTPDPTRKDEPRHG